MSSTLIVPLGGLGDIGMNLLYLENQGQGLIVDCGIGFPDDHLAGVETLIPDIQYILDRKAHIRGMVITHGHEDHIGAIPHILRQLPMDVYARPFTLDLIRNKLKEYPCPENVIFHEVQPRQKVKIGPNSPFWVTWLDVTHSIPESSCLVIDTPEQRLFHSGDFRIDTHPFYGDPFNPEQFQHLGPIDLMFCDSTNVESAGSNPPDSSLLPVIERYLNSHNGRVIVSLFSSHIGRVGQVLEACRNTGRLATLAGRGLLTYSEIAKRHGYLQGYSDILVPIEDAGSVPENQLVVLATGSQGEQGSALHRMSRNDHRHIKVTPQDLILISARVIPGNDKAVSRMTNDLHRLGATVLLGDEGGLHISGHGKRDEVATLIKLVQPKNLLPVHGEYRMMLKCKQLAIELGVPQSFVAENGHVLEISASKGLSFVEQFEAGAVLVEGAPGQDVSKVVLKDRIKISEAGLALCVLVRRHSQHNKWSEPTLTTKGIAQIDDQPEIMTKALRTIQDTVKEYSSQSTETLQEEVRRALRRYFRAVTGKKPEVIVLVHEI